MKTLFIFISSLIVIIVVIGFWFLVFGREPIMEQSQKLEFLSPKEISFLGATGFLDKGLPRKEKAKISRFDLKSPNLIEQKLDSLEESFEVLAVKLDLDQSNYQLAFKLENRTGKEKEFYLIPISDENQLTFQGIEGTAPIIDKPLTEIFDLEKHKKELRPELAEAYDDIENNNYQASPVKITLKPKSILLANSQWQIDTKCHPERSEGSRGFQNGRDSSASPQNDKNCQLKPVYLLVYGSAGGVKDDLIILNVHSHPQQGENWEVEFTTRGKADLKIIPYDQATIDDDEFKGLYCGPKKTTPQILENDVVYYPNWQCLETAKIIHYTKKAGKHTLKFEFGGESAFAYNNPGMNLVVPIEMLDLGFNGSSATAVRTVSRSSVSLNDGNYDGATYYFEIVATNSNTTTDYDVDLIDAANTVYATVTVSASTTVATRFRTAAFTPASGNTTYKIRIDQVAVNSQIVVFTARIIIVQVDATKTRIQIPLMGRDSVGGGVAYGIDSTTSTTYTQGNATYYGLFKKDTNVFATLSSWSFEAFLQVSNASGISYAALYNATDNTEVANSELSTNSTGGLLKTASLTNTETNFDEDDNFEVRIKVSDAAYIARPSNAYLYVYLTSLSKAEVFQRTAKQDAAGTAADTYQEDRAKIDINSYTSPTVYIEATGYCADNAERFDLQDDGTDDSGTAGSSKVTNSGINFNSGTKARLRTTSAMTLTDGNRYWGNKVASTNSGQITNMFVVFQMEVVAAAEAVRIKGGLKVKGGWKIKF